MQEEINPQKLRELETKLEQFHGLTEIKFSIHALIRLLQAWRNEKQYSIEYTTIPLHLVFAGESGTGKTQAAQLIAQIYHALGFLSEGGLIKKDAELLVHEDISQIMHSATGNVLLLYHLRALTEEALTSLLDTLNQNQEDIALILMGTQQEVEEILETCPLLRLKFCKYFGFSDFQAEDFRIQPPSRKLEIFDVSALAGQEEQLEALQEAEFPTPSRPVPKKLDRYTRTGEVLCAGARLDLSPYTKDEIRIRLVYERLKLNMELDAYVFMLREDELTGCDEDMVFFGNLISRNGGAAIVEGARYPEAAFLLHRVYQDIQKIAVCFSAYGNQPEFDFSQVEKPVLQVFFKDKQIAYMDLQHLQTERTLVAIELYRYKNHWKLRAIGAGYRDGLEELCRRYGVEVE